MQTKSWVINTQPGEYFPEEAIGRNPHNQWAYRRTLRVSECTEGPSNMQLLDQVEVDMMLNTTLVYRLLLIVESLEVSKKVEDSPRDKSA